MIFFLSPFVLGEKDPVQSGRDEGATKHVGGKVSRRSVGRRHHEEAGDSQGQRNGGNIRNRAQETVKVVPEIRIVKPMMITI